MTDLVPMVVSAVPGAGTFKLTRNSGISVAPPTETNIAVANYLVQKLRPATGYDLKINSTADIATKGNLSFRTDDDAVHLGQEGYELTISVDSLILTAHKTAGLFRGIQTIRQLLPARIESSDLQHGPWLISTGTITDYPRFAWRGAMLDVARHFIPLADVKRFIDTMAAYKLNIFHIHLTDDQGWRIDIKDWPALTEIGGSTQVGGGPGGYYSRSEFQELIDYAGERHIVVVPEIDLPGHTNAALASYPELNCDSVAPELYTDTSVGFSSLCLDKQLTYDFIEDVIVDIAAMSPGPYIHIGADEAFGSEESEYTAFVERVQQIVNDQGKAMIGWEEASIAPLKATSIVQYWRSDIVNEAVVQGAKVILSPNLRSYLNKKYDPSTPYGVPLGYIDVQEAYSWDPASEVEGLSEEDILGLEAATWTENIEDYDQVEFMNFPRLLGIAEIGWTPKDARTWTDYQRRLGHQGPRMEYLGLNFFESELIDWQVENE